MTKRSLRVYLIAHHDGRFTGILLRAWGFVLDRPAPAAYGASEEDVLRRLEAELCARIATGDDDLDRYLWEESFEVRSLSVDVHPQTTVKRTAVVGRRRIPLRLTYLASKLAEGGYRVMLPRFGWSVVLEDLSIAPEVLRQLVTSGLLGESPRSLFDFRREGEEVVRPWSPRLPSAAEASGRRPRDERPTLGAVAEDLVEKAARQRLPLAVGESEELERALSLFDPASAAQRGARGAGGTGGTPSEPPPSILLVGGPGVGKTTWVHRLARRFAAWRRDKARAGSPGLFSTSSDRLLAGMMYLGMWQERCLKLVDELSHEGDLLHVGALLPLLRPQPDGASIGEVFLPALRSGEVSLIAECTEPELEACQRRAASLVSCFQVVRLREPEPAAVPALLAEYEARKDARVRLHPAGKKRLVQHLSMFRRDVLFPGKAFRFFDWLAQESSSRAGAEVGAAAKTEAAGARVLYPRDVSEAYARHSGLPIELIADEVPASAATIASGLKRRVIGQDEACDTAARVLARFKAGMNDPERPCGALLFVGPTGVGKTELAKELTRAMFGDEGRMIRLDMSEYRLPGASARLLHAGSDATTLAQRVRQQPLSLVLLDEIEKAHREVFDLLLGILGEGRLTDEDGRHVDFRMALIVMTSNLGVADRAPVGFGSGGEDGAAHAPPGPRRAAPAGVREHFRPEFVNRIDHVVQFRSLGRDSVLRIVDLELEKAESRTGLVRRNLRLRVLPEARARLAEVGFDPRRGARPLKRVIEEQVITPIAARMAEDPGCRDREIVVAGGGAGIEVRFG
ncbi:ATP-dependent Clp protease ATP-binding subunit [Sorangium cellulosum]|uniref:ATP-dependent Clp protease ATP-binding subunit n=1 Tax=Sorangium cellulosum TaxID=56 RepID=A0A2L0F612_SORCE|nr:AAA family ATPase [Sorangium cellulosum]AUX47006.1 ATP-dependent Clp protease ATP-binding subunit [Sorangium cellulosum]